MLKFFKKLARNEDGASTLEYIFIIALIAVALTWFRYDRPNKADHLPVSVATAKTLSLN